ncbi:Serine/threonine protein kinase domain protein [Rhodopirellula maiorica SM1]|uniref:Serine/threonine protein kinase domain protein n=1 Tax=Rhodopirellula maiorica SM1 TaxID=1265738 RepID=M5RBI0_9BACT|nr:WD40 repeat domain-containing serine/threonine-protein kinase [Rhodopirellula maiorica]EMI16740.1 Serine/threonine protein kinase domain protein [Rhodopirellula maiorica SM1]
MIKQLGEGTFGRVWLAHDIGLNREVAIKFPKFNLATDQLSTRRFQREAEIAAGLSHPNLIPILDAVLTPKKAYIVSEYCPGPTLDQWMHQQNHLVSIDTAVSIVIQIASGLKVAHERDLMHRDIKPSNIIISKDEQGRPFANLTDFGMARSLSDVRETMIGTPVGSAPYMSPEQACGSIDTHGAHSDVYSLGVILYELLTGVSPFAAASQMSTIRRVMEHDPPPPRDIRPTISRDLSAVVQRCLEKKPYRRYHDAGELYDDLIRVAERRPTSARPIGRVGRTMRWAQRNPMIASLASVAMIGVWFGIASLCMFALNQRRYAIESREQTLQLQSALHYADQSKSRLRALHYDSDLSLAYQMFNRGQYGEARRLLNLHLPRDGEPDLRSTEWSLLDGEVSAKYALWGRHAKPARELAILPDKQTVVTTGDDGVLMFWDIATETKRRQLSGFNGQSTAIAAMPDGSLAIPGPMWPFGHRGVISIDPNTGETLRAFHLHPTTIESIRVAGDTLVSGCRYNGIKSWSFKRSQSIDIPSEIRNESVGLTPDGKTIVTGERDVAKLRFYDAETGQLLREADTRGGVLQLECCEKRDWVAYTVRQENGVGIAPIDPQPGESATPFWIPTQSEPMAIAFSDDASSLAVADFRAGVEWFKQTDTDADQQSSAAFASSTFVSGSGGRMTDVEFLSSDSLVTTGLDGRVERFSPDRLGHELFSRPPSPLHHSGTAFTSDFQHALVLTYGPENIANLLQYAELPKRGDVAKSTSGVPTPVVYRDLWKSERAISAIAMSADDRMIATTDLGGLLSTWTRWQSENPIRKTAQLPMFESNDSYNRLSFSPSGRYLVVGGRVDMLQVFDLNESTLKPMLSRPNESGTHCVAYSSDDQQLAFVTGNELEVIHLPSRGSQRWKTSFERACCVAFTPNGKRIVVGWEDGSLSSIDIKTRKQHAMLHGVTFSGEFAMRPSAIHFLTNHRLLMMTDSGSLQFWDMDKQLQLGTLAVWKSNYWDTYCDAIRLNHDATQMIIGYNNGDNSRIYRWNIPSPDLDETPTLDPQDNIYAKR